MSSDDQRVILRPDRHVQNGYTLAHLPDGHPVFIHGGLPDEKIRCRIIRSNKHHSFALAEEIIEKSSLRTDSDCPIFPLCGGCSYRHISYKDELNIKRKLLKDLPEIGSLIDEKTLMISDAPNESRNHIQIQHNGKEFGFFRIYSNEVIPLPKSGCRQVNADLNKAVMFYRYSGAGKYRFRYVNGEILSPEIIEQDGIVSENIMLKDEKFSWEFPAGSFFQSNRFLIGPWLDTIRSFIPPERQATIELFSGSGIIGGAIRHLVGDYCGYESDKKSIIQARSTFKKKNLSGEFFVRDLYVRPLTIEEKFRTAIIDPPRAGLNKSLQRSLAGSGIKRIIYSSCNPVTLDRDVKALRQQGNFTVTNTVIFDFFPRTRHMEMVLVLDR